MDFSDTYVGKLRRLVGSRLLLVPGARVVVENIDGHILLQKRSDIGVWGLPGGNAEEGENLEAVAIREVQEETGLVVTQLNPFGFSCDPKVETITFPNGDRCQYFVLNFFTRHFEGNPQPADDESTECAWFSSDNLPQMLPNMRQSVECYMRFLTSGQFQMIGA